MSTPEDQIMLKPFDAVTNLEVMALAGETGRLRAENASLKEAISLSEDSRLMDEYLKLERANARQAERIAELDAETGVLRTKYEAFSDQQHTIAAQSAVISMAKTAIRKLQENTDDYYDSAREAAQYGNEVLAAINALPEMADQWLPIETAPETSAPSRRKRRTIPRGCYDNTRDER